MKIQNQVCALEYSKKLHELGVKKSSIFVWEYYDDKCYDVKFIPYAVVPNESNGCRLYHAYTVCELLELLQKELNLDDDYYKEMRLRTDYEEGKYYISYEANYFTVYDEITSDSNICYSLAKMLIHLIENGLVKVEDLNK